jgi:hypothetical protein
LNHVAVLSLKGPASGIASSVRPTSPEVAYSLSVAFSNGNCEVSVGKLNRTSMRAFSPMTGSGGTASGSPTELERTSSS